MSEPFIGEIRMWGLNFAPQGWAFCNGDTMAANQNPALFALLGVTFGGSMNQQTFKLPDMRGRVPVHQGNNYDMGLYYGFETVSLDLATMPAHTHSFTADGDPGDKTGPKKAYTFGKASAGNNLYGAATSLVELNPAVISGAQGGGQAHSNMQPSAVVNFCIALTGIFPARN